MFDVVLNEARDLQIKRLLNEERNKSNEVMMKMCGLALGFLTINFSCFGFLRVPFVLDNELTLKLTQNV